MSSWDQLGTALDAAARRGETIRFWWRDDDAGREHPALSRLMDLAERKAAPLALAVVPSWLEPQAQGCIAASAQVTVLQHGFAHANHAGEGAKSIETGGREPETVLEELKQGLGILADAFGAAFLPVLVPPWNRIDAALYPHLETAGYRGLSVYGTRTAPEILPGVGLVNTHVDPVDWRGTRGFVGEEAVLQRLIDYLSPDEPIGLLSHHLVMDESGWTFFEQLFTVLGRHPSARLYPAPYLFERLGSSV
ncbi:MAG: polysaccharide deacetylase family protein [Geminicoccaceae bacterium]